MGTTDVGCRYFFRVFLYLLVVTFLGVITVSRYIGNEPGYLSMAIACPLASAVVAFAVYIRYKKYGARQVFFKRRSTPAGRLLQVLLGSFALVFSVICALIWLRLVDMDEARIWITAAAAALVTALVYLSMPWE